MCHIRNPVGSLSVQQASQHLFSQHSLTFTSWTNPETNYSISFRTIPVHFLMQTSRISTWFIMNYTKFARFTKMPKCADQQNKIQKYIFNGSYFPKQFIFYRYLDIPNKVAHTKYAVAKTCICGVKLITVIHVLKLLTMFFCIEFQIPELMLTRCQKWMLQNHCIPHDVYLLRVLTRAGYDAKSTRRL